VKTRVVQDDRAFLDFVPVGQFKGAEGVRQFYQAVSTAFPDLHIEVTAEHDLPGCSIREGYVTGTHLGEYMGIPASGVPVHIAVAVFFIFDKISGELLGERCIWITELFSCSYKEKRLLPPYKTEKTEKPSDWKSLRMPKGPELTTVDPLLSLSIRAVALTALLLWVPIVASFRFAPGARWAGYVGIFYHIAVFLLVFKLPAPEWARAAGYGWLLLDVAAGVLGINQIHPAIAQPAIAQHIRLGGISLPGSGLSWRRCRARLRRSWWVCQLAQSFLPIPLRHPFWREYGLVRRRFSCRSGSRFLPGRMASDVFRTATDPLF
jgi:hypothetical protein